MSFVAAAGLAISVGGSLYQGDQAKQAGKIQGIFAESQARLEEAQALDTAMLIRKAGQRQRGAAKAGYVASGVRLGEGSAQAVEEEITQGYEHDAYQAILEGKNRARGSRQIGENAVQAGRDANSAAMNNAAGTALSGYGAIKKSSGWRTNGPGYSGTQAPAPVTTYNIPRG